MSSVTEIKEISISPDDQVEIKQAVSSALSLGLSTEVCGTWVWVSGDTKPVKDTLKEQGFKWSPKKKVWYFKPSSCKRFFRSNTDMQDIRLRHGSLRLRAK